jgi:hypothetical protein
MQTVTLEILENARKQEVYKKNRLLKEQRLWRRKILSFY